MRIPVFAHLWHQFFIEILKIWELKRHLHENHVYHVSCKKIPLCCSLHVIVSFIIHIYHLYAWNRLIETFKTETSFAAIALDFTRTRKKRISYEYIKGITFVVKLTPCEAFEKISSTLHRINVKIARCTDTSKHLVSISSPFYHWQLILRDTCCWGEVAFAKVLVARSSSKPVYRDQTHVSSAPRLRYQGVECFRAFLRLVTEWFINPLYHSINVLQRDRLENYYAIQGKPVTKVKRPERARNAIAAAILAARQLDNSALHVRWSLSLSNDPRHNL